MGWDEHIVNALVCLALRKPLVYFDNCGFLYLRAYQGANVNGSLEAE